MVLRKMSKSSFALAWQQIEGRDEKEDDDDDDDEALKTRFVVETRDSGQGVATGSHAGSHGGRLGAVWQPPMVVPAL